MSMAPDPGKILDLFSLLDEDLQARTSFDSLLQRAVSRLPELWSSIVLARAYTPEGNGLRLVAATDDSQAKTMESADPFAKAMTERRVIHNAKHGLWGLPLADHQQIFGLLVLQLNEDTPETESWLRLLAALIVQMIVRQSAENADETRRSAAALSRQVSVLQTLNDLSTVISMARDEAQLLNQSGQALVTALSIDYAQIYMLDAGQQTGTIVSEYPHRGNTGRKLRAEEVPVANPPDTRNPAPVVVNNIDADERVTERGRLMLQADNIHSFMLLPLFVRGQVVGGIRLDIRRENRGFTPDMTEIAQTILAQVVVGLQNIRLLAESQRRSEQLQRVNQFSQTLQSTLDMREILETALTEIHRIIPVERMTIGLLDPGTDTLRTVGLFANGENYLTLTNGVPMQLQESPVGRAWENRRLLHIPDIVQEHGIGADDVRELRALLVTPLLGRSEAPGIISVGHSQPYIYGETDIIVFQQMIGLLSAAIENASAFARSQRQARNEALVNEIATQLQQQVELDDMLQIAANDLGRALGARRARIRLGTKVTE